MTREEKLQKAHQMFDNRNLLTELKWQREYFNRGYVSKQEELFNLWIFDECIKALEQNPCEDCVSREEVIKINQKYHGYMPNEVNHKMWKEFNELSSVQPIRIHAKWMHVNEGYNDEAWVCSNCKKDSPFDYDFCPNCGEKMESEDT